MEPKILEQEYLEASQKLQEFETELERGYWEVVVDSLAFQLERFHLQHTGG